MQSGRIYQIAKEVAVDVMNLNVEVNTIIFIFKFLYGERFRNPVEFMLKDRILPNVIMQVIASRFILPHGLFTRLWLPYFNGLVKEKEKLSPARVRRKVKFYFLKALESCACQFRGVEDKVKNIPFLKSLNDPFTDKFFNVLNHNLSHDVAVYLDELSRS